MKVLQVNKLYYPWVGGVEKIVQQVAEGLNKKEGFDMGVLCCQPKGKARSETIGGVRVYRSGSLGVFMGLPVSFDFFSLFKKLSKEADVLDLHHPFPLGDLAIFLFKPRAKLVVHYHSDIVRQKIFNFLILPLVRNTLRKAEKIIVSNPNLAKNSPVLRGFQHKREVIPFGIELEKFKKKDEQGIAKIKEKYNDFVLFVGRLSYYKGIDYLIEAMKEVSANLVIIGQGALENKLKAKIKELGLENKIFILPPQPEKELINFYQACSVFVLPSIFKSEAFGIVLIEAMACARPLISTELGTGTSFVNQNNITGLVVPPKDSLALTRAIAQILSDKKLSQKFAENARKRVEQEFSLEKMLQETERMYNSITNKSH
jgi:glycosyltransferase involved in cell wall biosynthesis